MRVEEKKLVPVLCDLTEYDLGNNPLIAFNYVHLSREGIRKLAESINISLGDTKLPPDMLAKTFDVWWPEFDAATKDIIANPDKGAAKKAFSLEDSYCGVQMRSFRSTSRAHREIKASPGQ